MPVSLLIRNKTLRSALRTGMIVQSVRHWPWKKENLSFSSKNSWQKQGSVMCSHETANPAMMGLGLETGRPRKAQVWPMWLISDKRWICVLLPTQTRLSSPLLFLRRCSQDDVVNSAKQQSGCHHCTANGAAGSASVRSPGTCSHYSRTAVCFLYILSGFKFI